LKCELKHVFTAYNSLWKGPERAEETLGEVRAENADLHRFEELLEKGDGLAAEAVKI